MILESLLSKMESIQTYQQKYHLGGKINFRDVNGVPVMDIASEKAKASVSLQGGQILSFSAHGEKEILFTAKEPGFARGKSIRSGAPVCWPWFGPHPTEGDYPAHGFIRNSPMELTSVKESEKGIHIELALKEDDHTLALFPFTFRFTVEICISEKLEISMVTINDDEKPFTISEAFHTYFLVGDIGNVSVSGLNGVHYLDKVAHETKTETSDSITIGGEVDRVYLHSSSTVTIRDTSMAREIVIEKEGSNSTVLWNPWIEKSQNLKLHENEYRTFVCVETANALENSVTIEPGQTHRHKATIYSRGL